MKKITLFSICCIVFIFLSGCQKEVLTNDQEHSNLTTVYQNYTFDQVQDAICQLGLNTDNIKICGSYARVENDLMIDLDKLFEPTMGTGSADARHYALEKADMPLRDNVNIIFYRLHSSVSSDPRWSPAIYAAIAEWNAINECHILFRNVGEQRDPQDTGPGQISFPPQLTFMMDDVANECFENLGMETHAIAKFPVNEEVGDLIVINADGPCETACCRRTVIKHELGHVLGFRHTTNSGDTPYVQCGGDIITAEYLETTPIDDNTSIMYPGILPDACIDFNDDDLFAFRACYPKDLTTIDLNIVVHYQLVPPNDDEEIWFEYDWVKPTDFQHYAMNIQIVKSATSQLISDESSYRYFPSMSPTFTGPQYGIGGYDFTFFFSNFKGDHTHTFTKHVFVLPEDGS